MALHRVRGISRQVRRWFSGAAVDSSVTPVTGGAVGWTDEAVFAEADAWYGDVLHAIAGARERVAVETYIIADDAIGRSLVEALLVAAARGVEVRLLVDGIGSAAEVRRVDRLAATATLLASHAVADALAVRVWNPLPWAIGRRVAAGQRWRWLARINRRDHRKLVIVDGATAWTGSINWVADHSRIQGGEHAWRDQGARVVGPGIAALAGAFEHAWARSWPLIEGRLRLRSFSLTRRAEPCALVRLNHTVRVRQASYRDLLRRIRNARRRIWIANAYVVPRGSLLRALAAAAARGVEVRLLVPGRSDHPVTPWIAATFADALSAAGAAVWAYRPRVLHAKTMLIDDQALVGSHNLNSRSFLHDLECEVVLSTPGSIAALEQAWADDLADSDLMKPPACARLRWWQRLAAQLALLAKRWI